MLKLENIKKNAQLQGIETNEIVRVVSIEPIGSDALTIYYKNSKGQLGEQMLFRTDEVRLSLAKEGRPWAFDASGEEFKLGLEAYRISQSALFDPMMAIHTSNVEPLPHQISAVYEYMLPKQPLRYVLADDPGAGKTIMAGLLICELLMRADAKRILIVSPGSLVEQWQDEMLEKFGTIFEIFDTDHLKDIMKRNALVEQHMSLEELYAVKDEIDKAEARKLQPYFIRAFFSEAFKSLRGEIRSRESGRSEIKHVPAIIRERDRTIGESRTPVLKKYHRICFEKDYVRIRNKPMADLIHPGHPLMHAITDLILSAHRGKLKQGAVLIDPNDDTIVPKILFMIDHTVREANSDKQTVVSRRLQFVEIDEKSQSTNAGWAPHLDLQTIKKSDLNLISDVLNADWITNNLEALALNHASQHLVPEHYEEVKSRRIRQADKILNAVNERLIKESNYWQDPYIKLSEDVDNGKQPRVQPEMARRRVEEITARLETRTQELHNMKNVVSSTPIVIGGALIIPQGLLAQRKGETNFCVDAVARARIEKVAMDAVIKVEQSFNHQIKDVSADKCGWDITARPPANADGSIQLDRHIEIKGRSKGQSTITVSRNEVIYGLNQAEKFLLAIVIVDGEHYDGPYYIKSPFTQEPDFGVASINYDLKELLSKSTTAEESL